jgi:hypothetical protein
MADFKKILEEFNKYKDIELLSLGDIKENELDKLEANFKPDLKFMGENPKEFGTGTAMMAKMFDGEKLEVSPLTIMILQTACENPAGVSLVGNLVRYIMQRDDLKRFDTWHMMIHFRKVPTTANLNKVFEVAKEKYWN